MAEGEKNSKFKKFKNGAPVATLENGAMRHDV
jgi:hypothetical protein